MNFEDIKINWYDAFVLAVLLYGFVDGIRSGMREKFVTAFANATAFVAAVAVCGPVGLYLEKRWHAPEPLANLLGFASVGFAVYTMFFVIRLFLKRWFSVRSKALVENTGGAILGIFGMVAAVSWLTVALALTRSPMIHDFVAENSLFGRQLTARITFLDFKPESERLWLLKKEIWQRPRSKQLDSNPDSLSE